MNTNGNKTRVALRNLTDPQQIRELNRQLEWIWNQLLGGLTDKAFGRSLQDRINGMASIYDLTTAIQQTNEMISLMATREELDNLGVVVAQNSTQIDQNATAISLKASQSALDEVSGSLQTTQLTFQVQPDGAHITKSDSDYEIVITDNEMHIMQNGMVVAKYAGNTMEVANGAFTQSLRVGGFGWFPDDGNGIMLLRM